MKKYVIGVDIGGTKVATGIISIRDGKLKKKVVLPTHAKDGFEGSLEQVYESIGKVLQMSGTGKEHIEGIGVCAPGPLNPVKGIVHNPPNLPGWNEVPLASLIRKKFRIKTRLENDANAAGMAEVIWGAARGYKHVLYVTVSTGIGTAIIINGKVFHGKNGMAGEGGHMTINYDDKYGKCNCGNIGCIEALASGPYTIKRLRRKLEKNPGLKTNLIDMVDGRLNDLTMIVLSDAADEGDRLALETIAEEGRLIGIWLGSMINVLDPEIIVIGGGVSLMGDVLFKEIRKTIPTHSINIFADKTPVVQARLKRDVGIFGAASVLLKPSEIAALEKGKKRQK
ncbi:MAG: ROK family protein [Candidatus Omnitrophica bacterium]|nr:ROK family protein [Candidatus Omnitrophota bacterium]